LSRRVELGVVGKLELAFDDPALLADREAQLAPEFTGGCATELLTLTGTEADIGDDIECTGRAVVLRGNV
jgi:hypothetical protein